MSEALRQKRDPWGESEFSPPPWVPPRKSRTAHPEDHQPPPTDVHAPATHATPQPYQPSTTLREAPTPTIRENEELYHLPSPVPRPGAWCSRRVITVNSERTGPLHHTRFVNGFVSDPAASSRARWIGHDDPRRRIRPQTPSRHRALRCAGVGSTPASPRSAPTWTQRAG